MASVRQYHSPPQRFQGCLFRVPDHQRGDAWTKRQLDDLWTDIELLDPKTQHFTGVGWSWALVTAQGSTGCLSAWVRTSGALTVESPQPSRHASRWHLEPHLQGGGIPKPG